MAQIVAFNTIAVKKHKGLRRYAPLLRGTPPKRYARLKKIGPRGRRQARTWWKARRSAFQDAGGRCQFPGCNAKAIHGHHIRLRSQGGENVSVNCLPVCSHHHQWIHAHPAIAEKMGLIRTEGNLHAIA